MFAHLDKKGDSWVIRAAQLTRKVRTADGTTAKLGEVMKSAPLLGTYQVYVSVNRNQTARRAQVEVRATSVTLIRPREGSTAFVLDHDIREVATNVVLVQEINAPRSCTPMQWGCTLGNLFRASRRASERSNTTSSARPWKSITNA